MRVALSWHATGRGPLGHSTCHAVSWSGSVPFVIKSIESLLKLIKFGGFVEVLMIFLRFQIQSAIQFFQCFPRAVDDYQVMDCVEVCTVVSRMRLQLSGKHFEINWVLLFHKPSMYRQSLLFDSRLSFVNNFSLGTVLFMYRMLKKNCHSSS